MDMPYRDEDSVPPMDDSVIEEMAREYDERFPTENINNYPYQSEQW